MSQVKKYKIGILFLLTLFSFFVFGCENTTPVNDICFNLDGGKQIVLIVGETLDMTDYVEIKPAYATNKKYKIVSFDKDIVEVVNNTIVAKEPGTTQIKVVADDNFLKESVMSVVVKAYKTVLDAPKNFNYNSNTQTFTFNPVTYASSYVIKINGNEVDLGNTNSYSLAQYGESAFDNKLVVQIKANAPTYTHAVESSAYSAEYAIYQTGRVQNIKIKNGVLTFDKVSRDARYNVYLDNELIIDNTADNIISLKNLAPQFDGVNGVISIEAVVSDEIIMANGNNVDYYNSVKQSVSVDVMKSPDVSVIAGKLNWQNVLHASKYEIFVDDVKCADTTTNSFDLTSLSNYNALFNDDMAHNVKVLPVLGTETENVLKTTKENVVKIKRLKVDANTIKCQGYDVVWSEIENVSVYSVVLSQSDDIIKSSTELNTFSMKNYTAGQYKIKVQAIAREGIGNDGVYYLSSSVQEKTFAKNETVNSQIINYNLCLLNIEDDDVLVEFEVNELNNYSSVVSADTIDLKGYNFSVGMHSITLKRLGDDNRIDSDVTSAEFVQLESIDTVSIVDGVVSVERSEINTNATIVLKTFGATLPEAIEKETVSYRYNHLNSDEKEFLSAGNYTTEVYVLGDGSQTFSHRENGNVKPTTFINFKVLDVPTFALNNPGSETLTFSATEVESFIVHNKTEDKQEMIDVNEYSFTLNEGSLTFAVQSKGDEQTELSSALSEDFVVSRLQTPTLRYNNVTNVITIVDENDISKEQKYEFKHNGVEVNYDFESAFVLTEENEFTLRAIAKSGNLYLNSHTHTLTLERIDNQVNISLNDSNDIVIAPVMHSEEFNLEVVFGLSSGNMTFSTQNGVLTNGEIDLNYSYINDTYVIEIINSEHNAIIPEMTSEFSVKVKFVKPSVGNDFLINSEYSLETSLNLVRIDAETAISVSLNNELVITPANHTQKYFLKLVVNNGSENLFVSQDDVLVCEENSMRLPYRYDNGSYYVSLLSNDYVNLINNLYANFSVKVQYCFENNGVSSHLDSAYSSTKNVEVLPKATIARENQTIKVSNVKQTYTYLNYNLLINKEYVLELDDTAINENGFIIVDINYIYSNVPNNILVGVNLIEAITVNIETTEDALALSQKGGNILVQKGDEVSLSSYKFNNNEDGKNNNSVVVGFDIIETAYEKEYIVEIYNEDEQNKVVKRYFDENAVNGKIEFNLDEILIEGNVFISCYLNVVDEYSSAEGLIYVFDSNDSNELRFNKVLSPSSIYVSDSSLNFEIIANAVGYEVYEKVGYSYIKLNENLLTTNQFNIVNLTGQRELVVKAISIVDGFTNSSYSVPITINKLATPIVSVVSGKFNVELSNDAVALIDNPSVEIILEAVNNSGKTIQINLKDLGKDVALTNNVLTIEPYLILSYNTENLAAENVEMRLIVTYAGAVDDIYYVNSNVSAISAYGMFTPTEITKTTNNNDSVEIISWTSSSKNVLNGNPISVGYVFKITYLYDDMEFSFYSNDSRLKYYDEASDTYKSYPSIIQTTEVIFPAGYDIIGNGKIDIGCIAGKYSIEVQTVIVSEVAGYNICNSQFTLTPYNFEIMAKPRLSVEEGKVVWSANANANKYKVSIYEVDGTEPIFVDSVTSPNYDFTNRNLESLTGVYKVVVKAISLKEDVLNSEESEELYIYRLPTVESAEIDDGQLVLSANTFFTNAVITFTDAASGESFILYHDNEETSTKNLANLRIADWSVLDDDVEIRTNKKFFISLDGDAIKILDGRDYTINVVLKGNTHASLGLIDSVKTTIVSNLTSTKLKPNTTEVSLGVIKYLPDGEYATISEQGVFSGIDLNYAFNGAVSTQFWHNTVLYKIVITSASGSVGIYAVDYYSFITAINNGIISADEYTLLEGTNNLYANVKYAYEMDDETQYLYFNVFKENTINLRDYDYLHYYLIEEEKEDGVNKLTSSSNYTTLNLSNGGSFAINVHMMGGDSKVESGVATGHLTAQTCELRTFVRYGENQLSTYKGKVQFINMTPIINEKQIDSPVYKLTVIPLSGNDSQVFYIYHTSESDAKTVAARHDAENYLDAIYLPIERITDENGEFVEGTEDLILFDLTEYFVAGTYKVSVRTLAGLGEGNKEDKNYLLNAKVPSVQYTYQKLADTRFKANKGVLEFEQSYIMQDGTKIYSDDYEITLYDVDLGEEYTYEISTTRESDGVKVNNATRIITYTIPSQILVDGQPVSIDGGRNYKIKVKALSADSYVINGTYFKNQTEDYVLNFEKSQGVSEQENERLRIENGMLKWKVLDLENYEYTVIKVSFLDEHSQAKNIFITVGDTNRYEIDGVYQYHYYEFTDDKYQLETVGSTGIVPDVDYLISVYTTGKTVGNRNIIHGNYSSLCSATRLEDVKHATIETFDGVLVWESVENAKSYIVTVIGEQEYTFTTETNLLDLGAIGEPLPVGEYVVKIKAIGEDKISSMTSKLVEGFTQLDVVDTESIRIDNRNIVWDEVENAQGYKVEFTYNGNVVLTEIVDSASYSTPGDISGKFTITVSAIGVGEGKVFNGRPSTFTSSSDAPTQVNKIEFDEEKSRFVIEVNTNDFLTGDKLLIVYNFAQYISNSELSDLKLRSKEIDYMQPGTYSKIDETTYHYYYPITEMGQYTNISVQVTRQGTVSSNAVSTTDVDFKLFAFGAGTEENPYRIQTAQQLLNLKYFNSAHYQLISAIDMSKADYEQKISSGYVIASEFSGTLDGNNYAIFGFNRDSEAKTDTITLSGQSNFALFGVLNNATIKNLVFGEENYQLIVLNTFAKDVANMINLSLITTGANNSIIENIKVLNFKIVLNTSVNKLVLNNKIYISALVGELTNSTISNVNVNFSVELKVGFSNDAYIAGVVAYANNSNIVNSTIKFVPMVSVSSDNIISYLGGVAAYFTGNASKSTGIKQTVAEMNISGIKSTNIGGLVGFANYINIQGCETSGTYNYSSINYDTCLGGLVGWAQSSQISKSGTKVVFNVKVNSTTNKFIGAIAGKLSVFNAISGSVSECYVYSYDYVEKTTISTSEIIIGMYTHKDSGVTITDCYKKEQ